MSIGRVPSPACRVLFVTLALHGCAHKTPPAPPPVVLVTDVVPEDVTIHDDFAGTLDGSVNASVQATVQGYLMSQHYKAGSEVRKGDLLFRIDPRPFDAALTQANAGLAQAAAVARQAEIVDQRNAAGLWSRA